MTVYVLTTNYINVDSGDYNHEVTRYRDYLSKELNKKRITIERTMELQELMNTCDWWTKEVMIHIDIEKEKTKKHDRECRKEKRLLDYFVKQVQKGTNIFKFYKLVDGKKYAIKLNDVLSCY